MLNDCVLISNLGMIYETDLQNAINTCFLLGRILMKNKFLLCKLGSSIYNGHIRSMYLDGENLIISLFPIVGMDYNKIGQLIDLGASQVVLVVNNSPANSADVKDVALIPGSGRSPGVGNGIPLQYSCLENSWTEKPDRLQSIASHRVRQD